MAKSRKSTNAKATVINNKKVENETVQAIREFAGITDVQIPEALQERFNSQIENVCKRIGKIADNLQKAIILEATKDEREAKKAERVTKRRIQLEAQLAAVQAKLTKLDS